MNLLNRLNIKAKLALLLAMSTVALVVTLALAGSFLHQRMMDDRVSQLRSMVETVHAFATSLEGEVKQGKITREQAIERLRGVLHTMKYDNGNGYFSVTRLDGVNLIHSGNPKREGTQIGNDVDKNGVSLVRRQIELARSPAREGLVSYSFPKPGMTEEQPKILYLKAFAPWDALINTGAYVDDIEADFRSVLVRLCLVILAIIAVVALLAFLVSRNISGALAGLTAKMEKLADGDLGVEVTEAAQSGEIGTMGKTVEVFKNNALAMRRLQVEQDELKSKAEREKKAALADLADNFENRIRGIVDVLSGAATKMQSSARSMSDTADSTRQQSLAVASGANQATANVQTVAAASEELSASISEIGRQVTQAATVSKKAADEGERTNATVAGLAEAAQKVGEVVKLINDIASQTNLLALNATIEAARAGDAGKGFAVVASEVKSLANQTAKATDEIRAQIAAIQSETNSAVDAIRNISTTILEVNEISSSIAAAVEEQTAATQEITRNVQQAASGTQDVSRNIDGVSKAVEESGSTATDVLAAADDLAEQSQVLRREVDQFLVTVRAA